VIACAFLGALLGILVRALFGVPWREALFFSVPVGIAAASVSL
jgi:hypothetical protein